MIHPPTYSPRTVCRALNINPGTLGQWANRDYLRGFDGERTVQGKARQFSLRDFLALALIKHFSDRNDVIWIVSLPGIAPEVAGLYLESGAKTLTCYDLHPYKDECGFVLNEPAPHNAITTVTVRLAPIFEDARLRLREEVWEPDAIRDVVLDIYDPIIPDPPRPKPRPRHFVVTPGGLRPLPPKPSEESE
jgi:hypothetical protein